MRISWLSSTETASDTATATTTRTADVVWAMSRLVRRMLSTSSCSQLPSKHGKQITSTVMMRYPLHFRLNEETKTNNYFQRSLEEMTAEKILKAAQDEFDNFVNLLRSKDIEVLILDDRHEINDDVVDIPDAIFPNNWITFHENGSICLYPMYAQNRRSERLSQDKLSNFMTQNGYLVKEFIDFSSSEEENLFLEGTGVLILDRPNQLAYCSLSPRAHPEMLHRFCERFHYLPISFTAFQTHENQRLPIYHTNVLMALGESFVIICLDSIDNPQERQMLLDSFQRTNKDIIEITEQQVHQFAGNMIQLCSRDQQKSFLVMSSTAHSCLTEQQKNQITSHSCEIIHAPLPTIEVCGGGSARCMLAEVFPYPAQAEAEAQTGAGTVS
jgi:hypothetical protein